MNHEQIWAPWRIGYIMGSDEPPQRFPAEKLLPDAAADCFLCQAAIEGDDRGRFVVARGPLTVTVLNRYPYNNGHLLVAPRRHCGRLQELQQAEQAEIAAETTRMVALLESLLKAQGFNIGLNLGHVAGAGLPGHLHWHIVPRWSGDTNFMPVMAGVRIIPQSLDALWESLTQQLSKA